MKNKIENYRVQEVIDANGESIFFIEKKSFFGIWYKWNFGIGFFDKEYAIRRIKAVCNVDSKYHYIKE